MENQTAKKILIVDDDENFTQALKTFLTGNGYSVVISFDATFAIQFATKENVSLIVLDLGLPCGGGFFVLENLRKLRKNSQIPIIVSTANVASGVAERVLELGATDFIQKPYDLEKLLEIVKFHLR